MCGIKGKEKVAGQKRGHGHFTKTASCGQLCLWVNTSLGCALGKGRGGKAESKVEAACLFPVVLVQPNHGF